MKLRHHQYDEREMKMNFGGGAFGCVFNHSVSASKPQRQCIEKKFMK